MSCKLCYRQWCSDNFLYILLICSTLLVGNIKPEWQENSVTHVTICNSLHNWYAWTSAYFRFVLLSLTYCECVCVRELGFTFGVCLRVFVFCVCLCVFSVCVLCMFVFSVCVCVFVFCTCVCLCVFVSVCVWCVFEFFCVCFVRVCVFCVWLCFCVLCVCLYFC